MACGSKQGLVHLVGWWGGQTQARQGIAGVLDGLCATLPSAFYAAACIRPSRRTVAYGEKKKKEEENKEKRWDVYSLICFQL